MFIWTKKLQPCKSPNHFVKLKIPVAVPQFFRMPTMVMRTAPETPTEKVANIFSPTQRYQPHPIDIMWRDVTIAT